MVGDLPVRRRLLHGLQPARVRRRVGVLGAALTILARPVPSSPGRARGRCHHRSGPQRTGDRSVRHRGLAGRRMGALVRFQKGAQPQMFLRGGLRAAQHVGHRQATTSTTRRLLFGLGLGGFQGGLKADHEVTRVPFLGLLSPPPSGRLLHPTYIWWSATMLTQ